MNHVTKRNTKTKPFGEEEEVEGLKRLRQYVHAVKEIQNKELSGQPHEHIRFILLARYNLCVDFLREIDKELEGKC